MTQATMAQLRAQGLARALVGRLMEQMALCPEPSEAAEMYWALAEFLRVAAADLEILAQVAELTAQLEQAQAAKAAAAAAH